MTARVFVDCGLKLMALNALLSILPTLRMLGWGGIFGRDTVLEFLLLLVVLSVLAFIIRYSDKFLALLRVPPASLDVPEIPTFRAYLGILSLVLLLRCIQSILVSLNSLVYLFRPSGPLFASTAGDFAIRQHVVSGLIVNVATAAVCVVAIMQAPKIAKWLYERQQQALATVKEEASPSA